MVIEPCNLNSGQICRKVGHADGGNEFSNKLQDDLRNIVFEEEYYI